MGKGLKKQGWWFYLVILVVCFILAGAIHTFMREPRGRDVGPPTDEAWKKVVEKVLGEPVDETMVENLRKGQFKPSDTERVEKAYGGDLNEEDRKKLKEVFERLKREGSLGEQPSKEH